MNLQSIGHLIAKQRRAKGLTLTQLAAHGAVGRSTLAALEAGKLRELGLERVARLIAPSLRLIRLVIPKSRNTQSGTLTPAPQCATVPTRA